MRRSPILLLTVLLVALLSIQTQANESSTGAAVAAGSYTAASQANAESIMLRQGSSDFASTVSPANDNGSQADKMLLETVTTNKDVSSSSGALSASTTTSLSATTSSDTSGSNTTAATLASVGAACALAVAAVVAVRKRKSLPVPTPSTPHGQDRTTFFQVEQGTFYDAHAHNTPAAMIV